MVIDLFQRAIDFGCLPHQDRGRNDMDGLVSTTRKDLVRLLEASGSQSLAPLTNNSVQIYGMTGKCAKYNETTGESMCVPVRVCSKLRRARQ